jgi:hypothetical protein
MDFMQLLCFMAQEMTAVAQKIPQISNGAAFDE